jgi:outer membrane protein TolC
VAAAGCSPQEYKAQADKQVYQIIDEKWNEDFGEKTNYTVNDVDPDPNAVKIAGIDYSKPLTLTEAVAIATAQNRNYQTQKESLYVSALDLTSFRHDFERQWFGTVDAAYLNTSNDENISAGGAVGFDQLLADGTAISTAIALDWARFLTGDPQESLGSVLTGTISRPLLRGAGRRIVQEGLTQAERNVLYEIRDFNRFRQTFVVSVITEYYRVLQSRDGVKNALSNYELVSDSLKRLEMEAEVGRKPYFEVDQAQQNVLRARDSYVRAVQSYQQDLDEFKITLALPTDANIVLDANELEVLYDAGVSQPEYSLNDAVETALESRLDLANSLDLIDDAVRKIAVAEDNLRAELNLSASANVSSAERTRVGRLQFQDGTYAMALEADLPFDRLDERNAYRETLLTLQRIQRQYENDLAEVKLDVREAYRQMQAVAQTYEIRKNSLELAQKRVESTTILLEEGRVQTRDLLDSQDALLQAQNDLTSALIDHLIAKLSFFRDVGVLQVKPDGMWEQKT